MALLFCINTGNKGKILCFEKKAKRNTFLSVLSEWRKKSWWRCIIRR